MRKQRTVLSLALLSALIIIAVPISGVGAQETFLWHSDVSSDGTPVDSPLLEAGREYRIVATGAFVSYDPSTEWVETRNFAADAQYYTPNPALYPSMEWWVWDVGNTFAAPDGHSFLQINGMDVAWGPFSNGQPDWSGHVYTIYYPGTGAPITFQIVDWIDGSYKWHECHIHVDIYEGPLIPVGETAFAYGGPEYATCFRSMGFKSWGWTNGPLPGDPVYTFDIWAGAGKCDLSKGTLVGILTIDYDGSTATVTYMMDAGWTMGFAQLYVGSEPLPRNPKGEYTVAPGQYPYIHYVDGATHTFTVSGLSGDIYVVAHTDVFEV